MHAICIYDFQELLHAFTCVVDGMDAVMAPCDAYREHARSDGVFSADGVFHVGLV